MRMKTAWLHDWSSRRGAVNKADGNLPVLVQEAPEFGRPYIHPLRAPKAGGILTENAPGSSSLAARPLRGLERCEWHWFLD